MKKNNGSLQLWLWTLTPLLLIGFGLYDADSWSRQPGTTPFLPSITTCILAVFTLVSLFAQHQLVLKERDSIGEEVMKNSMYIYNAGWIILIAGGLFNAFVYMMVVAMSGFTGVN